MTKLQIFLVLLLTVVSQLHLVNSSNQSWRKKEFFRQLLGSDDDNGVSDAPLMKQYTLKQKDSNELSHKRVRRGKVKTVGTIFYWLTTGGSIVASGGMAAAFIRLGFDNFFNSNRHCCGFSCCTRLCTDKDRFDKMKSQLFATSRNIDAKWDEVEKTKNYIDNLNRLIQELKTEFSTYDKNLMYLIRSVSDKTEQQILDIINVQVNEIKKLGTYRLTVKQLEDNYFNSIFAPMETTAKQLGAISSDVTLAYEAVRQLRQNTIQQVHTAFSAAESGNYDRITITSLSPYGYSANLAFTTEIAAIDNFFKTVWVEIPAAIFRDGWNIITVFSAVQDVFYKTMQLQKCTDLNNRLQEAIRTIEPELVKAETLYNRTISAKNEIDRIYNTLRNNLKATTLSTYNDQAMNVLASSTFQSAYVSSFNALQDFNTKIQTTITRDELEITLLPNLIKAFTKLSNKYACVDLKISSVTSSVTLCKNQNTMYTTDEVISIAIAKEKTVLGQSKCTDTSSSTSQEIKTYLQYASTKDGTFNSDCLLNSLSVYHRVCNEWRTYLTNDAIVTSLRTSNLAPVTSLTSSQVDAFVTKGCTPNDVSENLKATICHKKTKNLSRKDMATLYSRHNTDQLNQAFDACLLSQNQYLIDTICKLKATEKRSLAYIQALTPYAHYTTSDVQQQYDACALNTEQKDLLCFLKEIGLTLDNIIADNDFPFYPKSLLEPEYNKCGINKEISVTDKRRICQYKTRLCNPNLCPLDNARFDSYKSKYGIDLVKKAYDSC